jgi:predicted DNA-binding WGR domain protein
MVMYLRLESIDREKNRLRWYVLGIWRDLWGGWVVLCEWGRLHERARGYRVVEAGDLDAARLELARIVAVRERHGYEMKQPPPG